MKRITVLVIFFALLLGLSIRSTANQDAAHAKQAIEKTIKDAYVDGIQNNQDIPAIRKGFHPDFTMLYVKEGKLVKVTLAQWVERIEASKAKKSDKPRPLTTHKIRHIDVEGHSAIASLDIFKDGKHVYTDHMALYHFEDGWKIVSKTFYVHKD